MLPDWADLVAFLPEWVGGPLAVGPLAVGLLAVGLLERRAAVASTLLAGLEMAKSGTVRLRQEEAFGPITLRRRDFAEDADG